MTLATSRGGSSISSAADSNANGVLVKCTVPAGPYYFQKDATTPATLGTFHAARTYNTVTGAYTYSAAITDAVAGATNSGIARRNASAAVHASDEFMEVVIFDNANDTIVVEQQSAAADYDYMSYVYDDGDQFNIYADTTTNADLGTTAAKTAASLATFEVHMAAKMNAVTGVGNPGNQGDIFSITNYVNDAAGGGVSVFNLGS